MNLSFDKNGDNKGSFTEQLAKLTGREIPEKVENATLLINENKRSAHEIKIYRIMPKEEWDIYFPVLKKYQKFMTGDRFRFSHDLIEMRNELLDAIEDNNQGLIKEKLKVFDESLDAEIKREEEGDKSRLENFLNLRGKPRELGDVRARNIYNDHNNHYKKIDENTGSLVVMKKDEIDCYNKADDALRFKYAVAYHKNEITLEMIADKDRILDLLEMYEFKKAGDMATLFLEKYFKI